ncbi:hypothetical protein [Evansella tamaricis]|uniref:Uncharacterized protein n=1 Tax=Evansella tamaricis TaxID=2069301 RepID=A0ABS6JLJ3_9BACI|nr:hypothetical protein [Evansella tamaricis]MBU9713722.1 hypothetical protein [Evansella tamaricis]
MNKKQMTFLVDFQQIKQNKQQVMEQSLSELYSMFFDYMEQKVNIREKIRAKQIFFHKTKNSREQFSNVIAPHFEHWFAFDYVTVIGSRMFDIFIREKKGTLSKSMLDLSGFMMLMALEPVKILEVNGKIIKYEKVFNKCKETASCYLFLPEVKKQDLVFIRILTVGTEKKIIGPIFAIDPPRCNLIIEQINKVNEQGNLRKYLKEYGIDYLRYQKGKT